MRTVSEFKQLLERAFHELETEHNITAKQNFWCCSGCGCSAIGGEQKEDGIGWTFYHSQDNEDLYENGRFYLTFGNDVGGEAAKPIGEKIVEVLKKYDIITEWDGDPNIRIQVIAETRKEVCPDSDDDEYDD